MGGVEATRIGEEWEMGWEREDVSCGYNIADRENEERSATSGQSPE